MENEKVYLKQFETKCLLRATGPSLVRLGASHRTCYGGNEYSQFTCENNEVLCQFS